MKKIERAAKFLSDHLGLFECPICHQPFESVADNQVTCLGGHAFNLSKKGTIYFLTRATNDQYDQDLFESRKAIADAGFWDPVLEEMLSHIPESDVVLDVGCGNGSHLSWLKAQKPTIRGIGMDISKSGIEMAGKYYPNNFWMVADLANIPMTESSVDTILNILTPSNYHEFKRLLSKDGQVIKVVPGSDYLRELRDFSSQKPYSNSEVVGNFKDQFSDINMKQITYQKTLDGKLLNDLVKMTPLGWQLSQKQVESFSQQTDQDITVDLNILIGKF